MDYSEFVEVYEKLSSTTKRLEKVSIIAEFLKKLVKEGKSEWIYLFNGRVVSDFPAVSKNLNEICPINSGKFPSKFIDITSARVN